MGKGKEEPLIDTDEEAMKAGKERRVRGDGRGGMEEGCRRNETHRGVFGNTVCPLSGYTRREFVVFTRRKIFDLLRERIGRVCSGYAPNGRLEVVFCWQLRE